MSHPATGSRLGAIRSAMSPAEWAGLAAMFAFILAGLFVVSWRLRGGASARQ